MHFVLLLCFSSSCCQFLWIFHWEEALSVSMFGACVTGSYAISTLVGPFHRKWRLSLDRKRPCPEAVLTGSMFCACPAFSPRFFFLTRVVQFWSEVTSPEEALSGSGLDRKYILRIPGFFRVFFLSSRTKCWLGVFSTTSTSYNHKKLPPFYFHIMHHYAS
jgi:hypothetical protein